MAGHHGDGGDLDEERRRRERYHVSDRDGRRLAALAPDLLERRERLL